MAELRVDPIALILEQFDEPRIVETIDKVRAPNGMWTRARANSSDVYLHQKLPEGIGNVYRQTAPSMFACFTKNSHVS